MSLEDLALEDTRLPALTVAANTCLLAFQKCRALPGVVAGGGPCRAMPVNPDAPDDMRTKRLRSWHEGGRNRSRAPANPLHQESPQKVLSDYYFASPRSWYREGSQEVWRAHSTIINLPIFED